eukprot:s319_g9.t1
MGFDLFVTGSILCGKKKAQNIPAPSWRARTLNQRFLDLSDDLAPEWEQEPQQDCLTAATVTPIAAAREVAPEPKGPTQVAMVAMDRARPHAAGSCVPCVFHASAQGCLKGQACRYCHLDHPLQPQSKRTRKITRDNVRDRVLELFRPPFNVEERHDALQQEAAKCYHSRLLIARFLADPQRAVQRLNTGSNQIVAEHEPLTPGVQPDAEHGALLPR